MKKIMSLAIASAAAAPAAFADFGMMGFCGTESGSAGFWILKGFFGVLFFAAASFIFSLIFWLTRQMVEKKKAKK